MNLRPTARKRRHLAGISAVLLSLFATAAFADDKPSAPDSVDWDYYQKLWLKDLPRATADEHKLAQYDAAKAVTFLEGVALQWTRQNECATCHTNVPYLMMVGNQPSAGDSTLEIRRRLISFALEKRSKHDELLSLYLVPIASALAVNDGVGTGTLDPQVRELLDYLWSTQSADGSWQYPVLPAFLPFLERDRSYLAYLMALAVGYAPGRYYETPAARAGFSALQQFIHDNPPASLHHEAVLLWASVRTPGLLSSADQKAIRDKLLQRQNKDGGWTLAALGTWERHDGPRNDPHSGSDGYATGLATLALCESGPAAATPAIRRSVSWLKANQRVSGRWYTASLFSSRFKNYLSNMATAYAVMAVNSCASLQGRAQDSGPPTTTAPLRRTP